MHDGQTGAPGPRVAHVRERAELDLTVGRAAVVEVALAVIAPEPFSGMVVYVDLQPFFCAHSVADGGKPDCAGLFGSSHPAR